MKQYGLKFLQDEYNYYLCLLEIPKDSIVIANDCKYRTDKALVLEIKQISLLYNSKSVFHKCFFASILRKTKYTVNEYVYSNLDTSKEICAEGIHYFPFFGVTLDYILAYFGRYKFNWENISIILVSWEQKIISEYEPVTNLIEAMSGNRNPIVIYKANIEAEKVNSLRKKLL